MKNEIFHPPRPVVSFPTRRPTGCAGADGQLPRKKLSKAYLVNELHACRSGVEWWQQLHETDSLAVLRALMEQDRWDWCRWLSVRLMSHQQKVEWAIFSAVQVLPLFNVQYPQDQRPRKAIKAAKAWLLSPNILTRSDAAAAHGAAGAAAYAAGAAAHGAGAYAAYAASSAAAAAAAAASTDAAAAYDAAGAAHAAAAHAGAGAAYDAANRVIRQKLAAKAIDILEAQ